MCEFFRVRFRVPTVFRLPYQSELGHEKNSHMALYYIKYIRMAKEVLIIRSSISSPLLRSTLFQGFAIAFLGVLILLLAGSFLPVAFLHTWGWSLFLISLGLITVGLLPYRRLSRLQLKPNELILVNSNQVVFSLQGRKLLTLPLQSVSQISYISLSKLYGIAIWLKPAPLAPIIIHQLPEKVKKLRQQGQRMGNADLFFPYFNQRAYDELMDWQYERNEE
jgi:hypothetical protein